ncbi:MAG: hypothetical protein M3266_08650 [Actinomycetota bacterium]|nr:hypothetical protein [Actinomycetota bacterium]
MPSVTWVRFAIWIAIGVIIYFLYSRRHSHWRPRGAQVCSPEETPT